MKTSRLQENLAETCLHNVRTIFRSHPGSSHIFPCSVFGWDDAQTPTKTGSSVDPLVFFCFSIKGQWLVAPAHARSTHSNPENHSTISNHSRIVSSKEVWKSNFRQYGVVKSAERRCNSAKVRRKKIHPRQMLETSLVFFNDSSVGSVEK